MNVVSMCSFYFQSKLTHFPNNRANLHHEVMQHILGSFRGNDTRTRNKYVKAFKCNLKKAS